MSVPGSIVIAAGGEFRLVDLTSILNDHTPCYPTDPPFQKSWHEWFGESKFCVSKLEMGAHSGTHVDAPLHFLGAEFPDVTQVPLRQFIGEATALDVPKLPGENLLVSDLEGAVILSGDIVLFRTGWDRRAGSAAFFQDEWPGIDPTLLEELIRRGVKAVGGDFPSVDSPAALAAGAPAHVLAARAGMPVFEGLANLHEATGGRFFFMGLPLRIEGGEASPIRAVALLPASPLADTSRR